MGFFIALIVGNVVSLATKGNKDRTIDTSLVNVKICYYFEKVLPKSWRRFQEPMTRQRSVKVADRIATQNNSLDKSRNGTNFEIRRENVDSFYVDADEETPEDRQTTLPLRGSRPSIDRTTNI